MPTPVPVIITEIPGNLARAVINGSFFKFQRAVLELATVLSDISSSEHGIYGAKMPVQRPLKVTLYQASLDIAYNPFAAPFFLSPLSTQINFRLFPFGVNGLNPYGAPSTAGMYPYICPSMVVGPQTHEILTSGTVLQPFTCSLENAGPWAAPGEVCPDIPGTPNYSLQ